MLQTPTPATISNMFAMPAVVPQNQGNQALFVRPKNLPPADTAIPAGSIGPPPVIQQRDIVTISMSEYGQSIWYQTRLLIQDEFRWLNVGATRLGVSLRQGEDLIIYSVLQSVPTIYKCSGGTNGDYPTEISLQDMYRLYAALQTANGPPIANLMAGDFRFGSSPIIPSFWMLSSTTISPTLRSIQGFNNTSNYPDTSQMTGAAEIGELGGFRIWLSSNAPLYPAASNLGQTIVNSFVGAGNPYIEVSLSGQTTRMIYRAPEFSGPLALQASLGATMIFGAGISEPTWIWQVYSTISSTNIA
jgi:N4-gp56 family major capsid protein